MRSKRSFFNKALFLCTIKQYWAIPVAALIATFFSVSGRFLGVDPTFLDVEDAIVTGCSIVGVQQFIWCGIMGAFCFGYMFRHKTAVAYHAFPVNRTTLFLTTYLGGLIMLFIPLTLNFLLAAAVVPGHPISLLALWYANCLLSMIFFYSMAAVMAMLTGQYFGYAMFYLVFNLLAAGVYALIDYAAQILVFGFSSDEIEGLASIAEWGSPVVKITDTASRWYESGSAQVMTALVRCTLIYAVAGIVLAFAAWLLYRMRQIEHAGDLLVFRALIPVFQVCFAVCFGLFGGMFLYEVLSLDRMWPVFAIECVISTFVGYLIATMLAHKAAKVKLKNVVIGIALAVLVGIVTVLFGAGVLGGENNIPAPEEIVSVEVHGYNINSVTLTEKDDPEAVAAVIDFQRAMLNEKADQINRFNRFGSYAGYGNDSYAYETSYTDSLGVTYHGYIDIASQISSNVWITYELTNGKTISRTYRIVADRDENLRDPNCAGAKFEALVDCIGNPAIQLKDVEYKTGEEISIETVTILNGASHVNTKIIRDPAKFEAVLDAVVQDANNGEILTVPIFAEKDWYDTAMSNIWISNDSSYSYYLTKNSTETMKVLKEIGIIGEDAGIASQGEFNALFWEGNVLEEIYYDK